MKISKQIIILSLLIISTLKAYDGMSIGIQSLEQNLIHSATFYQDNLFAGLDLARMSTNTSSSDYTNYDSNSISDLSSSSEGSLSMNLLMPRKGIECHSKKKESL